jgi:hypothetical protein
VCVYCINSKTDHFLSVYQTSHICVLLCTTNKRVLNFNFIIQPNNNSSAISSNMVAIVIVIYELGNKLQYVLTNLV